LIRIKVFGLDLAFKMAEMYWSATRGLVRCGHCNCLYTPEKKKKKSGLEYVYYHCTERRGKCKSGWIREEEMTSQFSSIFDSIHTRQ